MTASTLLLLLLLRFRIKATPNRRFGLRPLYAFFLVSCFPLLLLLPNSTRWIPCTIVQHTLHSLALRESLLQYVYLLMDLFGWLTSISLRDTLDGIQLYVYSMARSNIYSMRFLIALGAAYGTSKAGIGIAGIGPFKPELVMKVQQTQHGYTIQPNLHDI